MFLLLLSCTDQETQIELLDGLPAKSSTAQVGRILEAKRLEKESVEESRTPEGGDVPPFAFTRWLVPRYTVGAITGEATLTFFNDRLWVARFYADSVEFVTSFERRHGISRGGLGRQSALDPRILARTGVDERGRLFIECADAQLSEEHDDWVSRYASRSADVRLDGENG